jgi:carbamoyltransferase
MTQRCGFKPNEEEYIMMGAAAFGDPKYVADIDSGLIETRVAPNFRLKVNLHRGAKKWRPDIDKIEDIAASVQSITEEFLCDLVRWARIMIDVPYLVMSGGVALNCVANEKIARSGAFESLWVMPNLRAHRAPDALGDTLSWTRH